MKISTLANLVTVRNHLAVIMNNTSVIKKENYKIADTILRSIDNAFIEAVKTLDLDKLEEPVAYPEDLLGPQEYIPDPEEETAFAREEAEREALAEVSNKVEFVSSAELVEAAVAVKAIAITPQENIADEESTKEEIAKRLAEEKKKLKGGFKRVASEP